MIGRDIGEVGVTNEPEREGRGLSRIQGGGRAEPIGGVSTIRAAHIVPGPAIAVSRPGGEGEASRGLGEGYEAFATPSPLPDASTKKSAG